MSATLSSDFIPGGRSFPAISAHLKPKIPLANCVLPSFQTFTNSTILDDISFSLLRRSSTFVAKEIAPAQFSPPAIIQFFKVISAWEGIKGRGKCISGFPPQPLPVKVFRNIPIFPKGGAFFLSRTYCYK